MDIIWKVECNKKKIFGEDLSDIDEDPNIAVTTELRETGRHNAI